MQLICNQYSYVIWGIYGYPFEISLHDKLVNFIDKKNILTSSSKYGSWYGAGGCGWATGWAGAGRTTGAGLWTGAGATAATGTGRWCGGITGFLWWETGIGVGWYFRVGGWYGVGVGEG